MHSLFMSAPSHPSILLLYHCTGWWYKPDYIINELNINSAITSPAHGEILPITSASEPYVIKGYAYTGRPP